MLLAGAPLLVATAIVFGVLVASDDPPPGIGFVFRIAQGVFVAAFLLRDAGGASPGKRFFGLRTAAPDAGRSPALASVGRNLPLLVPGWNLLEAFLVLRWGRRTGDRLAGTAVLEV